jgi:membrane fusion protein, multidrug efflux system
MADASAATEIATPVAAQAQTEKRKRLFAILAIALLIIGIAVAIWWFVTQRGRVETDNAYVGADSAQITALVSGPVAEVRVGGTQTVRKGDVLVVLDDSDARIDVATAEAALRQAQQRYQQATANVGAAAAKVTARDADIAQARARLAEADAGLQRARIDLSRREALVASGAVSGEELSSARAAYATAKAARDLASAGIATARATQVSAGNDVTATAALVRGTTIETAPDVASARARLEKARLDLARTVIRAPIGGIVANKQVQTGQRINAGTPIMTVVPIETAYVDANFKESQFRRLRINQPVELTSDFYGGDVVYRGRITGLAGGTGAAFALIPAQNATGNWVKVVQRLPVRIALDPAQVKAHPLRVGLSMAVTVDTRGE